MRFLQGNRDLSLRHRLHMDSSGHGAIIEPRWSDRKKAWLNHAVSDIFGRCGAAAITQPVRPTDDNTGEAAAALLSG
jgi:hypothetical protein